MPYPSLTYENLLDNLTRAELQELVALIQGYLSQQHKEDGSHADVTADSLEVAGDGTFDGNVTADADGNPVVIGTLGSAPCIDLQAVVGGVTSRWRWFAGFDSANPKFALKDVGSVSDDSAIDVIRTGASTYVIKPHSSGITLSLGQNTAGARLSDVNMLSLVSVIAHLTGAIAPSQITSDQNNYDPAGLSSASRVYLTSDAARDITGIAGQSDGRLLWLVNSGSFAITLKNVSGSSSSGNQIAGANGADVILRPTNGNVLLHYSTQSGTGFWYVHGA